MRFINSLYGSKYVHVSFHAWSAASLWNLECIRIHEQCRLPSARPWLQFRFLNVTNTP